MNMLSGIVHSDMIDRNVNFDQFDSAAMLLFRCSSGEGWHEIMTD